MRTLTTVAALCLAGCFFKPAPMVGPSTIIVQSVIPTPHQSAVASDTTVRVQFQTSNIARDERDLFAASELAELIGPNGAKVPVSTTSTVTNMIEGVETILTPNGPLAPGWYDIVLSEDLPSFLEGHGFTRRADGRLFTRFLVGSRPALLGLTKCAGPELTVTFSEPLPAFSDVVVEVSGRTCVMDERSRVGWPTPAFMFDCGALAADLDVRVTGRALSGEVIVPFDEAAQFPVSVTLQRSLQPPECLEWFAWQ